MASKNSVRERQRPRVGVDREDAVLDAGIADALHGSRRR